MMEACETCKTITVSVEGLRVDYRSFSLDIDSFTLPAGTTTALLGPSGSGKSTLLTVIGMLEKPSAGRILFDGVPVTAKEAREHMTAVFQRPYLIKGTVAQNVAYGLKLHGVARNEIARRVAEALELVGLTGMGERSVSRLSGGEAQRVALARAIALKPSVLLLDEPLASLDALLKRKLAREFARVLKELRITALYITHDYDEALVLADHLAVIDKGRILAAGPVDEVTDVVRDPWVANFFGLEMPIITQVRGVRDGLVELGVGIQSIFAVDRGYATGDEVLASVQPQDVILSLPSESPGVISAQNRITASVLEIEPRGSTFRVILDVGTAQFGSSVSLAAVRELDLGPGVEVVAIFKATAVKTVRA